ncbi:unnamed protein product [Gordionus sp. m RMFG-2023]
MWMPHKNIGIAEWMAQAELPNIDFEGLIAIDQALPEVKAAPSLYFIDKSSYLDKRFGGYHTQLIKFINGTERYEFKIEDLDLDSIYYLNIYTQYENDTKGHISSRRTFKFQELTKEFKIDEIPRGYQVDVRFKGNIQIGDFSLNATISMARMIKLNDGLAVQVFWDFASEIKLFCVSMVSTYPGKNFSKKATIWGKTYHIFENVEPKNEYRISIRLCPLFLKHKYYYTTHQVFITAP